MNKEVRIQKFLHRVKFQDLSREYLKQLVGLARGEDLEGMGLKKPPEFAGDVTSSLMLRSGVGRATLHAREPMVVCGLALIPIVIEVYHAGLRFEAAMEDGNQARASEALGTLKGPANELLTAERVLLNFLQFLSGVATETHRYIDALGDSPTRLLDTRKTTPGFRMLQKYAVACGGGWNHRLGLFDRVMLKDNHLAADAAQSGEALTRLVRKARQKNPELLIEVEVDGLKQLPAVLEAEPDKVMLDNFSVQDLEKAVALVGDRACTEATGGITLEKLPKLARVGLDFISTGALVHQAVWKDIGLDWD